MDIVITLSFVIMLLAFVAVTMTYVAYLKRLATVAVFTVQDI
jgi:hypothetical protein